MKKDSFQICFIAIAIITIIIIIDHTPPATLLFMDHGWVMQATTNVSNYARRLAAATTMDLYISLVDFFSCIEKFLVSQSKISSTIRQ